jgi:hypothetical protein
MACLFPILVVIGFTPDYQAGAINAYWFLHVHGAIMTLWILVFLAQAVLAAKGNLKFHRKLGLISAALGVLVFVSIAIATIHAKIAYSPPVGDNDAWGILAQQLYGLVLFGLFFTWGITVRKNAAPHKRLLLIATIVLVQAAVDRIRFLPQPALYVRFIYLDILLIPLFIYDIFTIRRIHKITMIGTVWIVIFQFAVTMAWGSPAWNKFAFSLFAPFMEQSIETKLNNAQIDPVLGYYGDKKWKLAVFRDGDKVYLKLPYADVPKFEITPTSETEWFLKITTWRISFIKSKDGTVTKMVNKQPSVTWEKPRFKQP